MVAENVSELYIAAPFRADRAGAEVFGYNLARRGFFQVSESALRALEVCQRFATLEEHGRAIRRVFSPMATSKVIESTLKALRESGLLISARELWPTVQLTKESNSERSPTVRAVYIPTRNRPEFAVRCARSHLEANSPNVRVRIIADGNATSRKRLEDGIASLPADQRSRVEIAGAFEKERFLGSLADRLGLDDEVQSAMMNVLGDSRASGQAIGANRNSIILDSAGEAFVSADDDTLSQIAIARTGMNDSEWTGALRFSSAEDPTGLNAYYDIGSMETEYSFSGENTVDGHCSLLGRRVGELMQSARVGVEEMSPQLVRRVMDKRCVVRATTYGLAGHPGRAGLGFLLKAEGSRRDRFCRNERILRNALISQTTVRRVPVATVSDATFFMTTHFGVDNTNVVPPFFPVGRNQDAVFAEMLLGLDSYAAVAHLPAAIRHDRTQAHSVKEESAVTPVFAFSAMVALLFHEFRPMTGAEPPELAMERAGDLFVSIASLPPSDFANLLKLHWQRFLADQIEQYQYLLDTYGGKPKFWAKRVTYVVEQIERQLRSPGVPVPVETAGFGNSEEAVKVCRSLLRQYGMVLRIWPHTWKTALQLRQEGNRLTVPIVP